MSDEILTEIEDVAEAQISLTVVHDGIQGPQGLQGIQGPQGEQGIPGVGIDGKTSYFHVKYSSVPSPTDAQMTETPSEYIGTYVDFTEQDSTSASKYTWARFQGLQGPQGEQGIPGVGINGKTSYLHIKYSNDGGTTFTADNGETPGDYIGTCTDFNVNDPTTVGSYTWAKIQGPKGNDGSTYYTWIKYADSPTSGMSDNPSGKAYIGIAYNKTSATESTTYADYSWSKIKGENGSDGKDGTNGTNGTDGNGITTITQYYARTTTFSKPSADAITATSPPALDNTYKYLWLKEVISFTKSSAQTMITLIAARGENGEMSAEQIAQLNKAAQDVSAAVTTANNANSKADSAVSTANTANTKVDNLRIGGTNLITNNKISYFPTSVQLGLKFTPINGIKSSVHISGTTTSEASTSIFGMLNSADKLIIEKNIPYTISVYGLPSGVVWGISTSTSNGGWSQESERFSTQSATLTYTNANVYSFRYLSIRFDSGITFDNDVYIKIEKGNKATTWSPSPEDIQQYTDDKVNNLEVGSVNLLRNTGKLEEWVRSATYMADAVFNGSEIKYPPERVVSGSSQTWDASIHMYPKIEYSLVKDRKVTVSFYARVDTTNSDTSQHISCILARSSNGSKNMTRSKYKTMLNVSANKLTTTWQRFTATATVNNAYFTSGTAGTNDIYVFLQLYNHTLSEVYVKDIQLEYGDKATAWSPAPEDTQAQIDNITKHLVIDEDSVDIVGDDGRVYASYGETASFYGSDSTFNINSDGFLMTRNSDDYTYFKVLKSGAGQSITITERATSDPSSYYVPETFQSLRYVAVVYSQGSNYLGHIAKITGTSGTWRKRTANTGNIENDYNSGTETSYTWSYNPDTRKFTKGMPVICAYMGIGKELSKIEFDGVELDRVLVRDKYTSTNGIWYYKKWSSGDCEIYGQITKSLALTTSSGNAYSTSGDQTELLPFTLSSGSIAIGNAVDKFTEAVTCHVAGQNLIWRPFRHASSSAADRTYAFIILGRWK